MLTICSRVLSLSLSWYLCWAHSFEEERKELGAVKAKLVKENEVKKARLEELEQQLTDFVNVRFSLSLSPSPSIGLQKDSLTFRV